MGINAQGFRHQLSPHPAHSIPRATAGSGLTGEDHGVPWETM